MAPHPDGDGVPAMKPRRRGGRAAGLKRARTDASAAKQAKVERGLESLGDLETYGHATTRKSQNNRILLGVSQQLLRQLAAGVMSVKKLQPSSPILGSSVGL